TSTNRPHCRTVAALDGTGIITMNNSPAKARAVESMRARIIRLRVVRWRENMRSIRFSAGVSLLILIAVASARAQTPPETPTAPPAAVARGPWMEYGVRFGPSFTSLTSVETFEPSDVAAAIEPTLNFGGFFTIGLPGPLSLQPEVLFAAKGHRIRDRNAPPISTTAGLKPAAADRVILVRYLEFPMLLRLAKQMGETGSVYLIGGPAFAIRRSAVVRDVADPGRLTDIGDLVNGSNLLYVFGAGLQHKRWLVDARLTRGAQNVAVDPQPSGVKTNAFSVLMGVRIK
ncbi:MAG: PorT family protein, partial [Acidobacteria bacterium]